MCLVAPVSLVCRQSLKGVLRLIELIVAVFVVVIVCVVDASSFVLDESAERLLYYEAEQDENFEQEIPPADLPADDEFTDKFAEHPSQAASGRSSGPVTPSTPSSAQATPVDISVDGEFTDEVLEQPRQAAPSTAGKRVDTRMLNGDYVPSMPSRLSTTGKCLAKDDLQGMTNEFINEVCKEVEKGC